jgi:hypothetical protein
MAQARCLEQGAFFHNARSHPRHTVGEFFGIAPARSADRQFQAIVDL